MKLSVIIPVYNSGPLLGDTLAAVLAGTRLPDELIVVDDGSTDASADLASNHGVKVISMAQNVGPAACRNEGVRQSTGDVLVFLDADTCPHPDTLARLEAHFQNDADLSAVIGAYDEQPRDPGRISRFRNLAHCFVRRVSRPRALTFWSGCGAVRRDVFFAAGGFDESYRRPSVEDIELGYRMSDGGSRILLDPATCVTHTKRWTLWSGVVTDIAYRGMPWTALLLERRSAPDDLNITVHHRLASLMTGAAIACMALAPRSLWWPAAGASLLIAAVGMDLPLLRFLRQRGGRRVALVAVPLILLQNVCKVVAAIAGALVFLEWKLTGRRRRRPWVSRVLAADPSLETSVSSREV